MINEHYKLANQIAQAIIDKSTDNNINCKVLLGYGRCFIICETNEHFEHSEIREIVERITHNTNNKVVYVEECQDDMGIGIGGAMKVCTKISEKMQDWIKNGWI